ncbi:MAG TPA: ABC transporter permease [Vicinamibacterales bacterium]|nr:ABC transporter permease [Vicinamibacterales bacterium]
MGDLRYAFRSLRKQPLFTLVAVLTLTLGIGANTAIFSLLYQVTLRPLPFREPSRLVYVWNLYAKSGTELSDVSIPDYLDRRSQAPAIEDAALFTPRDATLLVGDTPEQLAALAVTPSFFTTLGRGPALGRAFGDADAVPGADTSVILTHHLWATHFSSDPAIVGRAIRLNGERREIVGVLAPDFELPRRDVALLVPFAFTPARISDEERGNEFSEMIARLRPGQTVAQLNAQMAAIVTRLMDRVPARADYMRNSGFTGVAVDMRETIVGNVSTSLYLLQAGVIVVLFIACANVANLLLMRAAGRRRELAVRTTLGASGSRILRQLMTEGALLSGLGAAGGLALAAAAIRWLTVLMGDQMPRGLDPSLDPVVLGFTIALTAVATVIFGVAPAIPAMRGRIAGALKEDSTRGSATRRTALVRAGLAAAEMSLAVLLLIGAGLLIKSFVRVARVDPGFSVDHVMTATMTLPSSRYGHAPATGAFWQGLLERTRAIPGVTAAGTISTLPFGGAMSAGSYRIVGRAIPAGGTPPHAHDDRAGGDYFRAMGIPLIEGRLFRDADTADAPRVVIVDRFFADKQFKGESAIGHQLNFGSQRNYTIVGVVGTINASDLAKPVPEERVYLSAAQLPLSSMSLVVKTDVDPSSIAPQIRDVVRSIDREQPIARMRTMEEWIARSLQIRKAPMTLVAMFGIVALLLSAIGIYGVLAFGVTERVREFAIRQALGADRASIRALVLGQGLRIAGTGMVLGVAGALLLGRYLRSLLFGVTTHDLGVVSGACAILITVALVACYLPARRAMRVEPMTALRDS